MSPGDMKKILDETKKTDGLDLHFHQRSKYVHDLGIYRNKVIRYQNMLCSCQTIIVQVNTHVWNQKVSVCVLKIGRSLDVDNGCSEHDLISVVR